MPLTGYFRRFSVSAEGRLYPRKRTSGPRLSFMSLNLLTKFRRALALGSGRTSKCADLTSKTGATAEIYRCSTTFSPAVGDKARRSAVAPKIRSPENLGLRVKYGLAALAKVVY
jgi:hypothetical protein